MSVQLPTGDLTSPTSFMNNTHMKLEHGLQVPVNQHTAASQAQQLLKPQSAMSPDILEHQQQQQQYLAAAMQQPQLPCSSSGGLQQAWPVQQQGSSAGMAGEVGFHAMPGFPAVPGFPAAASPNSAYPNAPSPNSMMHPGAALPSADSVASHGSSELVPGAAGCDSQQYGATSSHLHLAAAGGVATAGGLPSVGAGSPRSAHSPVLSQFGGMGSAAANNCSADSLKSVPNGQMMMSGMPALQQPHPGSLTLQACGSPSLYHHQQQPQPQPQQQSTQQHHSSRTQHHSSGRSSSSVAAAAAAAAAAGDSQQVFRSQYRGVSYDKKKRKWRVQIKVAALGKSGVSVGYFDTEDAAARAYDRAAIGLLGRQNCRAILNFPIEEYDHDSVPELVGKSREEVKATLKSERAKMPRRRLTNRRRTSRYLGVGSSNRKNQWQARILYHGKVTHLGYYRTEEEAARVYDKVSISLHGAGAQTNFPIDQYKHEVGSLQQKLSGLTREELQRALGVKPMDKSSRYRGVSKKKGRWEAKVLLNRKWAYREMFDTEAEAARAYDIAVWRLKPREARSYVNFKDSCPPDVAEVLKSLDKDQQLVQHPTGLPMTAKPLIDAGLLYDDEGQSIRAPNGVTRSVSIGDLVSLGDSAGQSASEEPSAGNASGSGGHQPAHSGGGASGGATGAVAGSAEGLGSIGFGGRVGMVKSASYSALSGLDGAVTSSLAVPQDPAAAAAAPVPIGSFGTSGRGLQGELTSHHMNPHAMLDVCAFQQQSQHLAEHMHQHQLAHGPHTHFNTSSGSANGGMGMHRVHSVPALRSFGSDTGSPNLPPAGGGRQGLGGVPAFGSAPVPHQQQQYQQQPQQHMFGGSGANIKLEGTFWNTELPYQTGEQQQQQQHHPAMRMSRSCGNLAFMATSGAGSPGPLATAPAAAGLSPGLPSPRGSLQGTFTSAADLGMDSKPLMVRVGSEQHLIAPNPQMGGLKGGMSRIASESHLSSLVPVSPSSNFLGASHFIGPERGLLGSDPGASAAAAAAAAGMVPQHSGHLQYQQQQQQYAQPPQHMQQQQQQYGYVGHGGYTAPMQHQQQQQQHQQQQQQPHYQQGSYGGSSGGSSAFMYPSLQQGLPQQQQPQHGLPSPTSAPMAAPDSAAAAAAQQQQQQGARLRRNSSSMHRAHSYAALESIDETNVFRSSHHGSSQPIGAEVDPSLRSGPVMVAQRAHSMPGMVPSGPVPGAAGGGGHGSYPAGLPPPQQQQQQQQQQHGYPGPYPGSHMPHAGHYDAAGPSAMHMGPSNGSQYYPGGSQGGMPAAHHHMAGAGADAALPMGAGGPGPHAGVYTSSSYGATPGSGMMPAPAPAGQGGFAAPGAAVPSHSSYSAVPPGGTGSYGMMPAHQPQQQHDQGMVGDTGGAQWALAGFGDQPDSPLGNVHIGGEDLDVTMAFLADNSPRRFSEAGGLADIGLALDPPPRLPSPSQSNSASALLYDSSLGLGGTDVSMKMDE